MAIVVLGISHHTAPVTVREKFAFSEGRIPEAVEKLKQLGVAEEGVILSTCNRVELYVSSPLDGNEAVSALKQYVQEQNQTAEPVGQEFYGYGEPRSVEHLFKVACGLDSMVLGETEILGQLKKAYEISLQHKLTGSRLNKLFQRAFNVAKQIRTETNIQRGSVSVGSAAVELAEKIFNTVKGRQVLVIGAGDTSEKTARALLSRGAQSIIVANRSYDRAVVLAEALGGRAVHWSDWSEIFPATDIVISSTAAPRFILDRPKLEPLMKLRENRPLLLVDIAVPRDIDPEVNFLENVFLYNIDDLQSIADDYLKQRQQEVARCEEIIRSKARELLSSVRHASGTDEGGGWAKPASA